jgi:hypothetical protein
MDSVSLYAYPEPEVVMRILLVCSCWLLFVIIHKVQFCGESKSKSTPQEHAAANIIRHAWGLYVQRRNLRSLCAIARKYKEYDAIWSDMPSHKLLVSFQDVITALLGSIDGISTYSNKVIRKERRQLVLLITDECS